MAKDDWIEGAIKSPGSFSKAAKSAGKGTMQYAKEKRESPGLLGKRARLAITLNKIRPKKGL